MNILEYIKEEKREIYNSAKTQYSKNKKEMTKIKKRFKEMENKLKEIEKENKSLIEKMHENCEHKKIIRKDYRSKGHIGEVYETNTYTCKRCGYVKSEKYEVFDTYYGERYKKIW